MRLTIEPEYDTADFEARVKQGDFAIRALMGDSFVLPLEDEAEADDDEDGYVAPIVIDMRYRSSSGESVRRVKLLKVQQEDHEVYICAWCFLREKYRQFKLSAILEIIDLVTGEVYDFPRTYFEELGILAQQTAEAKALMACAADLAVLAFLGQCDGQFHPLEQDAIVKHICLQSDEPLDEAIIRRRTGGIAPDIRAFQSAMRRLNGNDSARRALVRAVRDVIDADGMVRPEEVEVGRKILRALGHPVEMP